MTAPTLDRSFACVDGRNLICSAASCRLSAIGRVVMLAPFEAFAVVTVLLFFKMVAIAIYQGVTRMRHDAFAKPEDAAAYGESEVADQEHPAVDRAQRALRNDLENIPIFLFLAWCVVELQVWPEAVAIYAGVFLLARIGHTVFYLNPTQPHRTISYTLGLLVSFVLSGHILYAVVS